jgi:hypothetical protein
MGIEVEVARPRPNVLTLHYSVSGKTSNLNLPQPVSPARADGLWRRTCFEVFVLALPGVSYFEFHFAPSRQWAAYRFDSYRSGMRELGPVAGPQIEMQAKAASYELRATLASEDPTVLAGDVAWRIGVSAVIEEANKRLSYWALAHPHGKPDFHRSDCFAVELHPPFVP